MATGSLDVGEGVGVGEGEGMRERGGVLASEGIFVPRGGVDMVGTANRAMLDDDTLDRPPMLATDVRELPPRGPNVPAAELARYCG